MLGSCLRSTPVRRVSSCVLTMSRQIGSIKFGNKNGKPYGEIIIPPASSADCDRSGYLPVDKLTFLLFQNRSKIYHKSVDKSPYTELFQELRKLNSEHFSFITTSKTEVDDRNYDCKWRRDYRDVPLLMRVQLFHVGGTSYSMLNDLMHYDDEDHQLARVVHHVTMVDPSTRRPTKLPEAFARAAEKMALQESLPYRVVLSQPSDTVHQYTTFIRWTDTDGYRHMTTTAYMRCILDAFYDALAQGRFQDHVDSNGILRVHEFQMRFIQESTEGQRMDIDVWEGPVGQLNFRMKRDDAVLNETMVTSKDHPNGRNVLTKHNF